MSDSSRTLLAARLKRIGFLILGLMILSGVFYKAVYPRLFKLYVGQTSAELTYPNSQRLTEDAFERLAAELTQQARREAASAIVRSDQTPLAREVKVEMLMKTPSLVRANAPAHIQYFREAGIRQYEGPKTCLKCHQTIQVQHGDGRRSRVDPLADVLDTVHFKFQSDDSGFSTVGYDGRRVNGPGTRHIPVGKVDRACGIPGSFSWTGWAALIETRPHGQPGEPVIRSEGCGQCHIGGNYYPATEEMMPIGKVPENARHGIDCLICHAADYDMNQRYVMRDRTGLRWNQDRSLRAAMSVGRAANANCLHCHQHNLGGDAYPHNQAAKSLGERNPRLLHAGAKRGNPFSATDDVHAAAGIQCTDCHVPEGHKIPRGRLGVDLVANDLPGKEVACETCHSRAPHNVSKDKALLNGHVARIACETCHIRELQPNNVVLRDWVHPTWNAEEGLWEPTDVYRSGQPGKGFTFLWFNGNGTFLANALGTNPNGPSDYDPLMRQMVRIQDPEVIAAIRAKAVELRKTYPDIDIDAYVKAATDPLSQLSPEMLERRQAMIRTNLSAAMTEGKSRIYPFKLFNALMYEDMANQGPFGAMILPFDYATYYQSGDTRASVIQALKDPILVRMYQTPFKLYMMDEFMAYFGVSGGWKTRYPLVNGKLGQVEPHWMRQMGTLMVNHGIQRAGRECRECHAPDGILDYAGLGYGAERAGELRNLEGLVLDWVQ